MQYREAHDAVCKQGSEGLQLVQFILEPGKHQEASSFESGCIRRIFVWKI